MPFPSVIRKGGSSVRSKEDWVRCKDWLNDEKVTPMSAKVPNLDEIETEAELYNYLKDGTELCRVIGMVTSGSVPTGITYRTNNVSNLEEKNIRLFISLVESELKIKDVFGKLKETVFRKYIDFYTVIDGLAKISKKIESKSGIKSFEKTKRKTDPLYEFDSDIHNIYDDNERAEETEHYEKLYEEFFGGAESVTSLTQALEELMKINNSYLKRCLKNIKANFIDKESTVKSKFLPLF